MKRRFHDGGRSPESRRSAFGNPAEAERFFQQQAAEKLLRAVLEVEGVPAGPTHDLRTLTDFLKADHALRDEFLLVDEWSSAATRFRYPAGSGEAPIVSKIVLRNRQTKLSELQATVGAFVSGRANEEPSR